MLKSFLKKLSKRDRRRPSRPGAMNFVTGDKGLGSSVVSVAKNNISRFNRVENAVPQQSLVSQLIPNISNPIERKGSKEDTNFISEYLDFFGSKKTAKTFKENLTFIKKSLTNTFEIAKILRVAIKNIVDQLKGLQGADGGGGIFGNLLKTLFSGLSSLIGGLVGTIVTAILGKLGLKNLAKIFKKTAPDAAKGALKGNKLFSRMGKFGKFGLIAGGLGLGGIAISNLLGNENMDKFGSILNKFERAIDSLTKKKTTGDDDNGGGRRSGGGPSGDVNAADIVADTPQEKAFIATVRELEGTAGAKGYSTFFGGSQYGGDLTKLTVSEVVALQKRFLAEGKGRFFDKQAGKYRQSAAVGAGQFLYPGEIAKKMGMDPTKVKFDEAFQNAAILYLARAKRGVDPSKELNESHFKILQKEWAGFGRYYGQTTRTTGQTTDVYLKNLVEAGGSVSPVTPKKEVTKEKPGKPAVTVVPLPAAQPAVQQSSSSPIISPQQHPDGGAPTATFLGSSNPDSAHTQLATRSTLNITE